MKLGRNDKCLCGSGKKYKRCCIDREDNADFLVLEKFQENFKKLWKKSHIKQCLHPIQENCSEKIIKAHSIQNNKILKELSDDGILMMPLAKPDNPFQAMTSWGRGQATIFTGFCGYHDNELFKPIENYNFNKSLEHVFLYTYRALAADYQKKQEAIKFSQMLYYEKPSLMRGNQPNLFSGFLYSVNDYAEEKLLFDEAIKTKDYDILDFIIWEFPQKIKFAAIGSQAPQSDLEGNLVQNLEDSSIAAKHLFFNIFSEGEKTFFIVSWLKENNDLFSSYIEELKTLTDEEKKNYINVLLPRATENIVINPTAWESMSKTEQESFLSVYSGEAEMIELMGEKYDMLSYKGFDLFSL